MSLPRVLIGAIVLALAAFAAGAAGWWFFIRDDAKLATNSRAIDDALRTAIATSAPCLVDAPRCNSPAAGSTTAPASDGLVFQIIPAQSEAGYFADEKLASLSLPSTAHGTTKEIAGAFYLTKDGFALDPSQISTFTVQLGNLKSDKSMRDNRVRNTLEVTTFPSATFTASSVSGVDAGLTADQEHSFQLTGTLEVHGVKKEVTWDVKARRDGDLMTGLATVKFLYSDFGMTAPNIGGFVAVQDDITIQVQVVAQAG